MIYISYDSHRVTVMLVTSLYWWHDYVSDFTMVTDSRRYWQNQYVAIFLSCWWFCQCIKSVTRISISSPTHLVAKIHRQIKNWFRVTRTGLHGRGPTNKLVWVKPILIEIDPFRAFPFETIGIGFNGFPSRFWIQFKFPIEIWFSISWGGRAYLRKKRFI